MHIIFIIMSQRYGFGGYGPGLYGGHYGSGGVTYGGDGIGYGIGFVTSGSGDGTYDSGVQLKI